MPDCRAVASPRHDEKATPVHGSVNRGRVVLGENSLSGRGICESPSSAAGTSGDAIRLSSGIGTAAAPRRTLPAPALLLWERRFPAHTKSFLWFGERQPDRDRVRPRRPGPLRVTEPPAQRSDTTPRARTSTDTAGSTSLPTRSPKILRPSMQWRAATQIWSSHILTNRYTIRPRLDFTPAKVHPREPCDQFSFARGLQTSKRAM